MHADEGQQIWIRGNDAVNGDRAEQVDCLLLEVTSLHLGESGASINASLSSERPWMVMSCGEEVSELAASRSRGLSRGLLALCPLCRDHVAQFQAARDSRERTISASWISRLPAPGGTVTSGNEHRDRFLICANRVGLGVDLAQQTRQLKIRLG